MGHLTMLAMKGIFNSRTHIFPVIILTKMFDSSNACS